MKTKRAISTHAHHRSAFIAAWKLRETKRITGSEIARQLGLKVRTVNSWLRTKRREGIAVHVQAPHVVAYRKAIRLWHKKKLSAWTIAKKLGLLAGLVRYWIKKEQVHEHRKSIG